jgi:hypothetical protein
MDEPTRMESETVVARCDMTFENMSQPMRGKLDEHVWKFVCTTPSEEALCISIFSPAHKPAAAPPKRRGRTHKLVEADLRSALVEHEPPSISKDGRTSDVDANDHVSEEEPFRDERLGRVSRGRAHDRVVRSIEAEGGGGETVAVRETKKEMVESEWKSARIRR